MSERTYRNALQPGYLLHWYRIDSVLGQGGFGITYLAHDTNLDHAVAIKEFLPMEMAMRDADQSVQPSSQEMDERFRWGLDRFVAEARTLARFRHPGIVRVLSVFEANNTAYMVMELERGETLHQRLARQRTLPEAELRALVETLLDGLEAVHAAGFVHRDIKPANIIVRPDGAPVLIDFGSARQAIGQYTRTLTTLISPGYAPYEQYLSGGDRQGPWTDIYSVAATLYRCVVGRAPLDALDRSEALLKSERDLYVPAADLAAGGYSPALLRAIDHGLRFKAADRPQSVAQWRRELRGEQEEPVTRVATTIVERGGREAPTAPMEPPAAAATTVRLTDPQSAAIAAPSKTEVRPRPGVRRGLLAFGVACAVAAAALWQWQIRPPTVPPTAQSKVLPATAPESEGAEAGPGRPAEPPSARLEEVPAADVEVSAGTSAPPPEATASATAPPEGATTEVRDRLSAAHAAAAAAGGHPEQYAAVAAKYRAVLELDPGNEEALAGLTSVAVLYAKESLDSLRADDLAAADAALAQAEAADAQAPLVATAHQQLAAVRSAAEAAARSVPAESPAAPESGQPGATPVRDAPEAAADREALALLDRADADLKADRLSAPRGANALERYQAVLGRDPENERAHAGIDAVAARYAELARGSLGRGDLERAERYIERGRALRPALASWPPLQEDLDSARRRRAAATRVAIATVPESPPPAPEAAASAAPVAPPPVAVAAPAPAVPTVAVQVVGLEKDFKRLGLSEEDIRAAVSQRLQSAGYQDSASGGLTLALVLKFNYNGTTGIYSFSTTVSARGSGKGGAAVNWSGGETGTAQDRDLRKLKDIFLKHVDAFLAAHPAG
ncbi:MAG: Serine/threonine-protein kinase PknD [Gammaproteobacteria bacterium]|nr:Serine/threonine-protein kinase PknD [Gammaproteobacteria bacterium]